MIRQATAVFRGWHMVGAAFAVMFVVYGIQFSFGTFVDDVVTDTGWSETRLQLVFAVYVFSYSVLSAVSGVLTDRFGPRVVVSAGSALLLVGYLVWATAPNLWLVFLGLGVIAPIGMSASWVPCNATVVRWFVERRGAAVALATSGGSLANIIVPPVAATLVQRYGWRTALASLALVGCTVMFASAQIFRRDPESVGERPDGASGPQEPIDEIAGGSVDGLTASEAMRTGAFWLILAIYSLSFLVVFVPFVHINQFATSLGIDVVTAATVISSIGVGGLTGRLLVGPVSDRFDRRRVVALAFAIQVLGFIGMATAQGLVLLYPAAAAFGFGYGASVAAFPPLIGDYFGRAHAGAIVGRLFGAAASLAAVGPYVAQLLVDASDSYRFAFALAAGANGAALALALQLAPVDGRSRPRAT